MSEYGLWEVGGTFVLPGTRKKVTLPFILVGDFSRQAASKALAPILRDKFHQDLTDRGGHAITTIGDSWALMNLQWRPYTPKTPLPALMGDRVNDYQVQDMRPEGWESETE